MSGSSIGLDDSLQRYLLDVSLREPEICERLRRQTEAMPEANMLSSPEQVQFLLFLARLIDADRGLEVGTFTGYTSLRLTLGIPDLHLVCCDVSDEYTSIAREYWREAEVDTRIGLSLAPALDTLNELLEGGGAGTFDFAYIDADKESYPAYVDLCLELVAPGGPIAIDNTLWSGAVADPHDNDDSTVAMRALNQQLHSRDDLDLTLIPIGDGLTLIRRPTP